MISWSAPDPTSVYPANTGVQFHSGEVPRPVPNANAEYIQQAIASIGAILKQREQDRIANQILAVDAPQATTPSGQSAPGTGQPDSQLSQAMIDQNLRLGYPTQDTAKQGDLGGVMGLAIHDAILGRQQSRQHDMLTNELLRARATHMRNIGPGGGSGIDTSSQPHGMYTVWRDGYGYVTPGQALTIDAGPTTGRTSEPTTAEGTMAKKFQKEFGVPAEDLQHMTNVDLVDAMGHSLYDVSTDPKNAAHVVDNQKDAFISADTPHGHLMARRQTLAPYVTGLKNYQAAVQPDSTSGDQYVVGKKYKDANGNVATYMGDGKWQ